MERCKQPIYDTERVNDLAVPSFPRPYLTGQSKVTLLSVIPGHKVPLRVHLLTDDLQWPSFWGNKSYQKRSYLWPDIITVHTHG